MPFPFKPRSVTLEITVGDDEVHKVKFVPVHLRWLYPLRQLGKKLSEAIGTLGAAKKFVEGKREDIADYDPETKSVIHSEIRTEPVDSAGVLKGIQLRNESIDKIIALFLEEESMKVLTDMVSSSLRQNDEPWNLTGEQLRTEADLDLLTQLVIGLVEAHQGVLDPLLRMRGLAAAVSESASGETGSIQQEREQEVLAS